MSSRWRYSVNDLASLIDEACGRKTGNETWKIAALLSALNAVLRRVDAQGMDDDDDVLSNARKVIERVGM
jgi:hypothetical protein